MSHLMTLKTTPRLAGSTKRFALLGVARNCGVRRDNFSRGRRPLCLGGSLYWRRAGLSAGSDFQMQQTPDFLDQDILRPVLGIEGYLLQPLHRRQQGVHPLKLHLGTSQLIDVGRSEGRRSGHTRFFQLGIFSLQRGSKLVDALLLRTGRRRQIGRHRWRFMKGRIKEIHTERLATTICAKHSHELRRVHMRHVASGCQRSDSLVTGVEWDTSEPPPWQLYQVWPATLVASADRDLLGTRGDASTAAGDYLRHG